VYVDESVQYQHVTGEAKPRRLYAVTGYIATFNRWLKLEHQWQEVLDHFGSPPFHLTEFMARQGDFKDLGWSDDKRNEYIELLCGIAAEHTIMGVGCGIYESDYTRALPRDLRYAWRDPYYFCIYGML